MNKFPQHIIGALENGEKIVGTVETELEGHTFWVAVFPIMRTSNFPLYMKHVKKNGQWAKYRINWVEMSDTYIEYY